MKRRRGRGERKEGEKMKMERVKFVRRDGGRETSGEAEWREGRSEERRGEERRGERDGWMDGYGLLGGKRLSLHSQGSRFDSYPPPHPKLSCHPSLCYSKNTD